MGQDTNPRLTQWRILRTDAPLSAAKLCGLTEELCRRNQFHSNVYVRPTAYKAATRIGVAPDENNAFAVVAVPFGDYLDSRRCLHVGASLLEAGRR